MVATRKRNEQETWQAHLRDKKQREELIQSQLIERQNLQIQINLLHGSQEKERLALLRDLTLAAKYEEKNRPAQERAKEKTSKAHDRDAPDIDFEPEI